MSNHDMTSGMLLFRAGTSLGYHRFVVANEKFINIFIRAPTKSDALGPPTLVNLPLVQRIVMQQQASLLLCSLC